MVSRRDRLSGVEIVDVNIYIVVRIVECTIDFIVSRERRRMQNYLS